MLGLEDIDMIGFDFVLELCFLILCLNLYFVFEYRCYSKPRVNIKMYKKIQFFNKINKLYKKSILNKYFYNILNTKLNPINLITKK